MQGQQMTALDLLNCLLMEAERIDLEKVGDPCEDEPSADFTIIGLANDEIKKIHLLMLQIEIEKETVVSKDIAVENILSQVFPESKKEKERLITEVTMLDKEIETLAMLLAYVLESTFPELAGTSNEKVICLFKGWKVGFKEDKKEAA
jgi:hypothetical protein